MGVVFVTLLSGRGVNKDWGKPFKKGYSHKP